jgi:hypothetical protein
MLKVYLVNHDDTILVHGTVSGGRTPHVIKWRDELFTIHRLGTSDTPTVYRLAHVAELENEELASAPAAAVPA